jgi:pimeloyl-ACP methyl ester carboxylesterase
MNERQYLAELESANADQLSELLRRPSIEEERVLALYFGEARLARLRRLALGVQRRGPKRGNVVVLHGIMGGELTVYPKAQSNQHIWMNIPRIVIGAIGWLRITPELTSEYDVRPTGILKKWYSEMLLGLAADQWNVQPFFYDWRLDLAEIADLLRAKIDGWFGASAPVNLVAHSMGGLVSRTFILRHGDRWNKGGRLVMLGTPNHGSFAIPQVITGAIDTVRKLAVVDIKHSRPEIVAILNTMPGSMQMLPSPLVMPAMEKMYDATTWSSYGVARKLLDLARTSHTRLQRIVDGTRMSYVAGCNKVTKVDVADWSRLDDPAGYTDSLAGDGTVPHQLGFLYQDGKRIPTYFVEVEHGALPNDADVLGATQQLLVTGTCSLPEQPPKARALVDVPAASDLKRARELGEEAELHELSRRIQAQTRGAREEVPSAVSADEVRVQEIVLRSFLAEEGAERVSGGGFPSGATARPPAKTPEAPPSIKIRLVHGGIEKYAELAPDVDAISVGHYIGVPPQNAELALDWAISTNHGKQRASESDLIISALHRRGVIVGELGQNFLLPDPHRPKRVIVIAGMGQPGTFREPELAVLARELVWMLGRSRRRHLYTVLIGGGVGNLDVPSAVRAWMRGIRRALNDARAGSEPRLETITFVEFYAANFILLDRALKEAVAAFGADSEPLRIDYTGPDAAELKRATAKAEAIAKNIAVKELREQLDSRKPARDREPVRLTIRLVRDTFEFAAVTADAAVPQRDTRIDPYLIDEANNQLPAATDYRTQDDTGNLLGRLLLPGDLREAVIKPPTPLVLTLDRTTARIHWEMLALASAHSPEGFDRENFLGTCCGLTRQLRTSFAPLPEPPLLSGRTLRVLVVADPAEDAPLPGAQEEGEAVVRIFEAFKTGSGLDVDVVALLGPRRATRVAVLEQLINHRFDILHYAGHCFYDEKDPSHCGWIFTGNRLLTADELNRVDRVPRFVFSNACESGITPEQREKRTALLAPSFAEAFFARGVANFVCTAWPVDDTAVLAFAHRVYEGILGLRGGSEPMHEAMAAARAEIARLGLGGLQTWGAYQHYGDPNFRVARPASPLPSGKARRAAPKSRGTAKRRHPKAVRRVRRK